jgi:hypothetical protein
MAQFVRTNDVYKFIYDLKTDTHIFMSKFGSFYTLTVRAQIANYMKGSGILVKGCTALTEAKRLRKRDANAVNCEECNKLFLSREYNINKDLLVKMCKFDCERTGNTSLSQMIVQVNSATGFAEVSDSKKDVTQLTQAIIESLDGSTITTSTLRSTSSTKSTTRKGGLTGASSDFKWTKNSRFFNSFSMIFLIILAYSIQN